mmetsp:Transcript_31116/g.72252  ORF Transcript_31116/g.72252 Transcript_31116/m.72252 type:complete len:128 (-) Transcript_31116:753-1136(-)
MCLAYTIHRGEHKGEVGKEGGGEGGRGHGHIGVAPTSSPLGATPLGMGATAIDDTGVGGTELGKALPEAPRQSFEGAFSLPKAIQAFDACCPLSVSSLPHTFTLPFSNMTSRDSDVWSLLWTPSPKA